MDAPGQDALARFHRALLEEILQSRPDYLSEPFTVSEIYQHLVPYRTHRDRIGVEMNGDYEDILLRLLAGEGDFLVLESDHARREIREELQSPNPNTGLYREFAAADVRLNPARVPVDLSQAAAERRPGDAAAGDGPQVFVPPAPVPAQGGNGAPAPPPRETPAPPAPAPVATQAAAADRAPSPEVPGEDAQATACKWCRETLPRRDNVNYCPFCGADVHKLPCPNCGEELELGWRFCVACGTPVGEGD